MVGLEASADISLEMAKLAVQSQIEPPVSSRMAESPSDIEVQLQALEKESDTPSDGNADREGT